MKILLKCATTIAGQKVPMTSIGKGKNAIAEKTCLEAPSIEARAAINRQHAILAPAKSAVNFELKQKTEAVKAVEK